MQITVVIPVYNGAKYLAETLQSLVDQTLKDFRVILVDDGSTDNTLAIARRFQSGNLNLEILKQQHRGVVAARNAALAAVNTPYMACLDSDDLALPGRLLTQLQQLEENADLVGVSSPAFLIDENSKQTGFQDQPCDPGTIRNHMKWEDCIINPASMMRTNAINKLGGYRTALEKAEDYDLFLRLLDVGDLANHYKPLIQYRIHASQLTSANRKEAKLAACLTQLDAWSRRTYGIDLDLEAASPEKNLLNHFEQILKSGSLPKIPTRALRTFASVLGSLEDRKTATNLIYKLQIQLLRAFKPGAAFKCARHFKRARNNPT